MKHLSFLLFLFALVCVQPQIALADAPTRTVFALIVTSNHGASGVRPDLHYADDDGVKYYELFKMLAPEANVVLHTELDPDTERLYPWARAVSHPPTKAAVAASIAELARRASAVTRAGGTAEFSFIFAGHGDVDAGVGFLELRDGRFSSTDLESMLRTIGATRSHVILDSCNSFFVVNARKPGGHPIATAAEAARTLGQRLPNVGVFLSTSAEAEVFEWSELQAGIFSHAVRSGLTGAADANGDGEVSYEELRAFVSVATAKIKNPLYRPTVFARGPGANASAPLVRLSDTHAKTLRIDGPQRRLTLRDADDVDLVDLHKEEGMAITLRLPERWATHASVEERDTTEQVRVLRRFTPDESKPDEPIVLAALASAPPASEARGVGDALRTLFALPFGPRAMAAAVVEVRNEDASAVYGASEDDVQRMRTLLSQAAGDAKGRRVTIGAAYVAFGAVLGTAGGWLLSRDEESPKKAYPYILVGYGGLMSGLGLVSFLSTSAEEDTFDAFSAALDSPRPPAGFPNAPPSAWRGLYVAGAERSLFALRDTAHRHRIRQRVLSFIVVGLSASLLVLNETEATKRRESETCPTGVTCTQYPTPSMESDVEWGKRLVYGSTLAFFATTAVASFVPYPVERLANVWDSDPGRVHRRTLQPNVAFAPAAGGGHLQLGWSF